MKSSPCHIDPYMSVFPVLFYPSSSYHYAELLFFLFLMQQQLHKFCFPAFSAWRCNITIFPCCYAGLIIKFMGYIIPCEMYDHLFKPCYWLFQSHDAVINGMSNSVSGSVKWYSPFGKAIWQCVSQAWKMFIALELVISLLGISHKEII